MYYVAPELIDSDDIGTGCDFWALGVMIHKMLTGEYLFNDSNDYLIFEKIWKLEFTLSD